MSTDIQKTPAEAITEIGDQQVSMREEGTNTENVSLPAEGTPSTCQLAGSIMQRDLLEALSSAIKANSARRSLPILSNVHISFRKEMEGNGLAILTCTNLEIAIRREAPAHVEQEGSFTVPAKLLLECVRTFPKDATLSLSVDERTLHLASGKRTYRLRGIDAAEFPLWPEFEDEADSPLFLATDELCQAIKETEYAAADDDTRPVLTGILCEISNARLTLVAADAFRLNIRVIGLPHPRIKESTLLVPVACMRTLHEVLPPGSRVSLRVDEKRQGVHFQSGPVQVVCRLIEGTFPNFRQIVPKKSHTVATIERKTLANALKGLAPFARESSNIAWITFTRPGKVTIETNAEDVGGGFEEMETPVEGTTDGRFSLNYRYLSDILAKTRENAFTFSFTTPDKPVLIEPVGRSDYWSIIMPMK